MIQDLPIRRLTPFARKSGGMLVDGRARRHAAREVGVFGCDALTNCLGASGR